MYIGYIWNWLIENVYLTYIFLCFSRIQGSRHEIGWWFQRKKTSRNYTGTMFIIIFIFWLCWMKWTFPMGWMYLAQFFLDVLHLWINVISDEIFLCNKFKLITLIPINKCWYENTYLNMRFKSIFGWWNIFFYVLWIRLEILECLLNYRAKTFFVRR